LKVRRNDSKDKENNKEIDSTTDVEGRANPLQSDVFAEEGKPQRELNLSISADRLEAKLPVIGDRIFYLINGRICPALALGYGQGDELHITYFDATCAGRAQGEQRVKKGLKNRHWWHSLHELEAALAYERNNRPAAAG
jgi:hypothetical protein